MTVPPTSLLLGASDWEAEGRVAKRELVVGRFQLDRFEATLGAWCRVHECVPPGMDAARAKSGLTFAEAESYCRLRGGRLPTEDEWIAAAAGPKGRRYPWGDTGAVCRRAAWGLQSGPCDGTAVGPDTVGAHPDGRTDSGLYDMAGNVAEWVRSGDATSSSAVTRGGSWATALATELRTWNRQEVSKETRSDEIGVRCAYDESSERSPLQP